MYNQIQVFFISHSVCLCVHQLRFDWMHSNRIFGFLLLFSFIHCHVLCTVYAVHKCLFAYVYRISCRSAATQSFYRIRNLVHFTRA